MGETKVSFSSPTPVKTKEPLRVRNTEELGDLPESHRVLLDFFNAMTSSLRLLKLRKKIATFENISRQVEKLTGRRFLSTHLRQIKYILPEAVVVDTILVRDEKTKCMKQHLKIELVFDVVKGLNEASVFLALSDLFSSRLRDFYINNPEVYDVPEATLPNQFIQETNEIPKYPLSKDSPTSSDGAETSNPSLLPLTFKTRFYQNPASEIKATNLPSLIQSPIKAVSVVYEELKGQSSVLSPSNRATTITPSKDVSTETKIMVATPVQLTPIRPISPSRSALTCEDESKKAVSQSLELPSSSAKKSLNFNYKEGEEDGDVVSREHIFARLTGLVILIHKIFQSVSFCPITKEELVHKIIMNDFDFEDNSEVETMVGRIEKLVPDWLWKKFAPSGDLLYNVKKVSDVNAVCERINAVSALA